MWDNMSGFWRMQCADDTFEITAKVRSENLNIAKGTTDPRVEFISQVQTHILIKFNLQNLNQASTSKSQPKNSLSMRIRLQNLDQT